VRFGDSVYHWHALHWSSLPAPGPPSLQQSLCPVRKTPSSRSQLYRHLLFLAPKFINWSSPPRRLHPDWRQPRLRSARATGSEPASHTIPQHAISFSVLRGGERDLSSITGMPSSVPEYALCSAREFQKLGCSSTWTANDLSEARTAVKGCLPP